MTLIRSISGIRGTIGSAVGDGLTPVDIVKYTSAYAEYIRKVSGKSKPVIVIGRDARISGVMVNDIVSGTLMAMGADVVNIGIATTPTTELAVVHEKADGGLIITASHNPKMWNALKLLNSKGEFLSDAEGKEVLNLAETGSFHYVDVDSLGTEAENTTYLRYHVNVVKDLPLVDCEAIRKANFKVVVDAVNSGGGIFIPELLRALGVEDIIEINCAPTGRFTHNPEPLPENLTEISRVVKDSGADVGFVVDPDVDRLAIVMDGGGMFGEEYTLVAVADYVLSHTPGPTVSNLSSTRALRDITLARGCDYYASAVGEVNVTTEMRRVGAVVGGEGNGGVIYPALHYGRDALVGVALFLTLLAKSGLKASELQKTYPDYSIYKTKIHLQPGIDVEADIEKVKRTFANEKITTTDGVKIDFDEGWVHLRQSNTEPIMRIYSEARTLELAKSQADKIKALIS